MRNFMAVFFTADQEQLFSVQIANFKRKRQRSFPKGPQVLSFQGFQESRGLGRPGASWDPEALEVLGSWRSQRSQTSRRCRGPGGPRGLRGPRVPGLGLTFLPCQILQLASKNADVTKKQCQIQRSNSMLQAYLKSPNEHLHKDILTRTPPHKF